MLDRPGRTGAMETLTQLEVQPMEHPMVRRSLIACAGVCLVALGAATAGADTAQIVAGTLTCKGSGGVGMILGSTQNLSCSFKTANGMTHPYSATITKVGIDIGFKGETVMIWTVLGSTTELPPAALAGDYGGVSADASVGVGAGVNALVGGSKNSIVLQPVSVQGQTGLNLAVGVSGLSLNYLP